MTLRLIRTLILVAAVIFSFNASALSLTLFGGGPRPAAAMQDFVADVKTIQSPQVLVITWASNIPNDVFESIRSDLSSAAAVNISSSLVPPKNATEREVFLTQLKAADAVFFSGGDQSRAMAAIERLNLKSILIEKYLSGTSFAGTSAGTAMMSEIMMTGDSTAPAKGLGLLRRTILDTHFLVRHREQRLIKAIQNRPEFLGVGIDEGAALKIIDNRWAEVLGPNRVVILSEVAGACEEFLLPGTCYDLKLRRQIKCQER